MNGWLAFLSRRTSFAVLVPFCVAFFLLVLAFGNPPEPRGLDPAWTEVQAWAFLHQVRWGRDLINTYGPLGFLHPYSAYLSGIFWSFAIGQIALAATFACASGLMFHRARAIDFGLFALAFLCCFVKLVGDVSWLLTLPFATTYLINRSDSGTRAPEYLALIFAPVFAAIALTKFTMFPIWVLCVTMVCVVRLLERDWRGALLIAATFFFALAAVWLACGQAPLDLPLYVRSGFEMATGYGHSAGQRGALVVEAVGLAVLFVFIGACVHAAWHARSSLVAVVSIGLTPLAAVLLWLAYFTRADKFHWPGFFAAMALLPFALLRNRHVEHSRTLRTALIAVIVASVLMGFTQTAPDAILRHAAARIRNNLRDLTHLSNLHDVREAQWQAAGNAVALPQIKARVGQARIDMVTWKQGMILSNGLNYAPRPVFQSHLAATPELARRNESYFLGPTAPEFVLFQLDTIDNRVPMSEDGLALMALLRRFRPLLSEEGFLLLQRDTSIATAAAFEADAPTIAVRMGTEVPIPQTGTPLVASIDGELNGFGKLYTLLFSEPALGITIDTGGAEPLHHRFIRLSAPSGFIVDPVVESTHDWLKLYFSKPLAQAQKFRIDTESPWERLLFQGDFKLSWRSLDVLHADSSTASAELRRALYPGFNLEPLAPADLRIVLEDGRESIFLHAPASLLFSPPPGRYRISAVFGIQSLALTSPGCAKANPDGVGISLLLHRAGHASVLRHADIDPFRHEWQRGPQQVRSQGVTIDAGDRVEYRVDPGPHGNTACDWSYVRDLAFRASDIVDNVADQDDRVFGGDFD